jgi:hypothetical protein
MSKLITTTNTDLTVNTQTAMIVQVGDVKFVKEQEFPWVNIFLTGGEVDDYVTQVENFEEEFVDLESMKIWAINWVFYNVEVVSEVN